MTYSMIVVLREARYLPALLREYVSLAAIERVAEQYAAEPVSAEALYMRLHNIAVQKIQESS